MKPYLRKEPPDFKKNIPDNTCFEAGYLVSKNADWRDERPVIDKDRCVGCLECYLYCPDGCIYREDDGKVSADPDFCKGCGICANVCPAAAIGMEPEV